MTRTQSFIIFFSIVLSVYALINTHIFIRGWQAIPAGSSLRPWYAVIFWVLAASFIVGRFAERIALSWFSSAIVWMGSFWLAAMAYLYLTVLAIDLLRLVNHLLPFFPTLLTKDPERTRAVTAMVVVSAVTAIVIGGHLNARAPRVRTLDLSIAKPSPIGRMTIVAATDIHLGTLVCRTFFDSIVDRINALEPDLVLLPGDIVDEDLGPVVRQNLGESLRRIRSRYGVYAITGNHEYIGGAEPACRYLTEHGVTMLRDSTAVVADGLVLVGREDLSAARFNGKQRKPLEEVMKDVDRSLPILLMDHQPSDLDAAVRNGADVQISGHTHHGQLWPFGYLAQLVYEVSWGYRKKGDTHVYVSCGVGTWGPPVRTGNRPEIVAMNLQFAGSERGR